MPDPIDDLFSTFQDGGTPVKPLPASEVRRRGDRMRRRHTTLATVGGVAAALVIATPFAVLAGRGADSSAPDPAPAPPDRVEWLQQIPAGFDLRTGLADGAESTDKPGVPSISLCGKTSFDAGLYTVDTAGATRRGAPNTDEPELNRTLALYPDDVTAAQAVDQLRDGVESCDSQQGPGDQTIDHEVLASTLPADESFLISSSYVSEGDDFAQAVSYFVVSRTGNAVLLTSDLGTVPFERQPTLEQERVADVVDAMQIFSEAENAAPDAGTLLPDDFPLDAGMTTAGSSTPARVFDDLSGDSLSSIVPCREEAWSYRDDEIVDVLGASWTDNVSAGEFRTLATYARGDDAAAALARIRDEVASCAAVTLRDVEAGDEAVAFTDPGATTYVAVRVGDALLLMQSVDTDPTDLVTRAAPVLEALAAR